MLRYILLLVSISATTSTDTAYRLNTPIKPSSYVITITPYFDTNDANEFTFDGEVAINFKTDTLTNQIKLHSENLTFTGENITVTSGTQNIALNAVAPVEFVTNYTFAFINLNSDLQPGTEYTLKIIYRGPIRKDLTGFYRNYYVQNGVKKWLGATQMEPTHARKAFPCFDEPELKATFTMTIDRPASYKPSLTNTKMQASVPLSNGYVREIFYPTPAMSTYLVAFLISEFEAAEYSSNGTREFGVFTRPDAKNQSSYAFDFGQRVEAALSAYFGIDYYTNSAYLKLDHVALPDFRAGAMENWGLVKYRESLLLYVPEVSTPYFKYRVAQIVAHETTHMWFGNLVTCHWWSNTWLNEGFANYFQDYITSLIEPDVGAGDMLVTGSVYSAYDADDSSKAVSITNNDVNSPAEISGHFGTITYQKAGSVIRMIHHLIGNESFILGLNVYLNDNKFISGYPDKLYKALDEGVTSANSLAAYNGAKIDDVMSSWISQAGHPMLNVKIDYESGKVTLMQKRFYINSSVDTNETYKIPITYTTELSPNFYNTKPAFIMDNATYTFNIANLSHSWVIFNIQETGLYRVNYDDHSWEIILSALNGNKRDQIHHLNRAKIINDLFALYYSDHVSFTRLRKGLEFLKDETDYSVWNAAIRGLNKVRKSYLGTEVLQEIDSYIIELTSPVISKLGYTPLYTEGTVALRNRMQILELACKAGHTGCVDNVVKLFEDLKENGKEISPSLRPLAYCYGLREGDEEDYEFLWKRMSETNVANEAWIIADVLGCTTKEIKLKKYLSAIQEEDSPIKTQDLTVPLTSVLAHYENVDLVFEELKNNYQAWSTIYPSMNTVLTTLASALHTDEEFAKYESWLSTCTHCSEDAIKDARTSLTEAQASASWAEGHKEEILSVLKNISYSISPSVFVVWFNIVAMAVFQLV